MATWRHIPQDSTLPSHSHKNTKLYNFLLLKAVSKNLKRPHSDAMHDVSPPPPPTSLNINFTASTWSELTFTVLDQTGSEALLTSGTLQNSLIYARDEPLLWQFLMWYFGTLYTIT